MKNLGTISKENIIGQLKSSQLRKITGGINPPSQAELGRSRSRSRSRKNPNPPGQLKNQEIIILNTK